MSNTKRIKNYWFVPKRANIHQMVALLHGIKIRNYNNKKWNTTKQDDLSLELKRLGATNSGEKIQPQGMRTLLASVHYLGFVYLDGASFLHVTKAGEKFYETHKNDLKILKSLRSPGTINTSEEVYNQMKKLQITNPLVLSYCEDILLFPFRFVLELLEDLTYLDIEELALIVFNANDVNSIEYTKQEIINFRNLNKKARKKTVDLFKETKIGNISLSQAPSAGYYMQLCVGTGYIDRYKFKPNNKEKELSCIKIKESHTSKIREMLKYYKNTVAYEYEDNLELWIEYFGDPNQLLPPKEYTVINKLTYEIYIEIYKNDIDLILADTLGEGLSLDFPVFENKKYTIHYYDIISSNLLYKEDIDCSNNKIKINKDIIQSNKNKYISYSKLNYEDIIEEILEHSKSKDFSKKMLRKIDILKRGTGISRNDSNLRGAQYEYLFYLLMNNMKEKALIDEVKWNGKIGKYNLPVPAPGGKLGTPDIIFQINDSHYILELTTMKSKSGQEKSELSSVPDHIRQYKNSLNDNTAKVYGIFIAPIIHDRVDIAMKANLHTEDIFFQSINDSDFIDLINVDSKYNLLTKLNSIFTSYL